MIRTLHATAKDALDRKVFAIVGGEVLREKRQEQFRNEMARVVKLLEPELADL